MFDQIYTTMIFKIALKVALIGYKPELLYNITRKQSINWRGLEMIIQLKFPKNISK